MIAALLAIGSALSYGVSDFLGGLASRRRSVLDATTLTFATAAAVLVVVVVVLPPIWSGAAVGAGVIAGVCNLVGMVAFYGALAIGPVSILSPAIAAVQAVVSVAAGIVTGDRFGLLGWAGILVALLAAALVGVPSGVRGLRVTRRAGVLALVSGLGLGGAVVALDAAPTESGQAPALAEIATGVAVIVLAQVGAAVVPGLRARIVALTGTPSDSPDAVPAPTTASRGRPAPWWLLAVATGVLMGAANALIVAALHEGELGIVGVLVGLYPVPTVLLAWLVLRERLAPHQLIGVVAAVGACVLLAVA